MRNTFIKKFSISLLIVAFCFLLYFLLWKNVSNFVTSMDHCSFLFCDFLGTYYPTGYNLFKTSTPAYLYFYGSFFTILLAGIANFSVHASLYIWLVLQVAILGLLIAVPSFRFSKKNPPYYYLYLILVLTSYPVLNNFKWGQVSALIVMLTLCAWFFYERGSKILSAITLGFLISIKYYSGLILIFFIFKRDKKILILTVAMIFIFLFVIPSLVLGLDQNLQFYKHILSDIASSKNTWIVEGSNSQFFPNVVARWMWPMGIELSRSFLIFFSYSLVLLQIVTLGYLHLSKKISDSWLSLSVLFCLTPFFVDTSWPHYFVYLPFCQTLALYNCKSDKKISVLRIVIVMSIFTGNLLCFEFFQNWISYNDAGILFISNTLILAASWSLIVRNMGLKLPTD